MNIIIDKNSSVPSYLQIAEQIKEKISSRELSPGDRLPTERELSEAVHISRGTIKRAYDELGDVGILERVQGSGTFVAQLQDLSILGNSDKADRVIDKMITTLSRMHLSYNEMEDLINSKLQWKRQESRNIRVAVVDCNMETLSLISSQLYNISDVDVTELILSDIVKCPQKLTYGYDLILTTKNHYLQVIDLVPRLASHVMKVAIVPSQKVQYELAGIHENMSVGIWCMSQEFASAVYDNTMTLGQGTPRIDFQLDNAPCSLSDFLKGKDVLILPYDYLSGSKSDELEVIQKFMQNGKQVIFFEYHIDQGSLIHITHELELCRENRRPVSL